MENKESAVDILSVARWFIKRGKEDNEPISHKKLQKLLYYAKHWSLYEDKSGDAKIQSPKNINIRAEFEAWVHGAVCRKVYAQYRDAGFNDLTQTTADTDLDTRDIDSGTAKFLEDVWNLYKKCTANELEALNHQEEAWLNQRLDLSKKTLTDRKISEKDMKLNRPRIPSPRYT